MRKLSLVTLILLVPAALLAQAPAGTSAANAAAPAAAGATAGRVAVVDMQRAITENAEGKKAQEKFKVEFEKKQKDFEEKQKLLADTQTKLQTGDKALSDATKAEMTRQVEKLNTDLQRMNDDGQKDLGDLQQQLFRPIAEKTQDVLKAYSSENGFAVVFDSSSQANSIIYASDVADITTEIIRRIDATPTKPATAPANQVSPAAPKK
ncbi:MAG TPA: OmpH family outer membrane protein [Terriglobia bacterium]|jgi:Skp family chaperone for outer membrane proteins